MPRGDGSGPMGMGPMSGRGAGYCAGFTGPGWGNSAFGYYGCGRGRGSRRMRPTTGIPGWGGYRSFFGYPGANDPGNDDPETKRLAAKQEASWLQRRIEVMEQALKDARERLTELNQ
jgi:hypothetical protein